MRILIGWLLFLFSIQGVADPDNAAVQSLQLEHTFQFDPYPDVYGQTVNSILQTIADGSGRLRAFTAYTFIMNVDAIVQKLNENQYLLTLKTRKKSVKGDVLYRDFSLEKVLVPDKARLNIAVHGKNGDLVFQEELRSVDIESENDILYEIVFNYEKNDGAFQIDLHNAFFYYDDRMHERFNDWTLALASYYTAGEKLLEVQDMVNDINTTDHINILLEEFSLCDAEEALGHILYAPFHDWVDIRDTDPDEIFPLYKKLNHTIDSLRSMFNHTIAHIDSLYYARAMGLAEGKCLSKGSEYFMSAVSFNPFHIPSQLALMQIEIHQADKEAAIKRLADIYAFMYPGGADKTETDQLADSLFGIFYDASWELIVEKRYLESLAVLENIVQFCDQTTGKHPCPPFLDVMIRQNHLGMYDSFIVVSSRALRNDNLELALTYIGSAIDYQKQHKEHIPDDNKALALIFRILTRYRVLYELSVILDDKDGAGEYLDQAKRLLSEKYGLYEYIKNHAGIDELNTAVINYAVLSSHLESIELLEILRSKGVDASMTGYQQRIAGKYAAKYYTELTPAVKPGQIFNDLKVHDRWYRAFRQGFLENW